MKLIAIVAHKDSYCNIVSCINPGEWGNGYCCMVQGNVSCCDDSFFNPVGNPISFPQDSKVFKNAIAAAQSSASASSSGKSTSSSAVESASETALPASGTAAAASASPKPSKDHSVAIGAGVGIPVGLLLLAILGFLLFRERKLRRNAEMRAQTSQHVGAWEQEKESKRYMQIAPEELAGNPVNPPELGTKHVHELGR